MSLRQLPLEILLNIAQYSHTVWYGLALTVKKFAYYSLERGDSAKNLFSTLKKFEGSLGFEDEYGRIFLDYAMVHILPNGIKHGPFTAYTVFMGDHITIA
jgi:hypothetical protein